MSRPLLRNLSAWARARWGFPALAAVALATPSARAADDSIRLAYAAPAGCIDEASFRARLLALPVAPGATPPREASLALTIEARDGRFVGVLTVTHADGGSMRRSVSSEQCDDVSDALEIVAAVALGLSTPPRRARAEGAPRPPPATPSSPPSGRWRPGGALRVALLDGAAPNVEVSPSLALTLALDRRGLLAPAFEISARWATSGNVVTSDGTAVITQWAGGVAVCPIRVLLGTSLALRPCAEAMVGVLTGSATGTRVTLAGTDVIPWVSLAPLGRAEWRWSDVFSMEIEGGPAFELYHDRFFFRPAGTPVYTVPTTGAVARIGVAARWP